jgi:Gylcosyl hydrolase family 115 C-terminal domain/F5/8 type C domain
MCKKLFFAISFVLVLGLGLANAKPLNQDPGPDGIVSVEAEHYDNKTKGQSGSEWVEVGPMGGFTGKAGMQVADGTEGTNNTNYAVESPGLEYEVNFVKTGTYYVWVLAWGPDGSGDSCHAGLDGQEIDTCDRMSGWNGTYNWSNGTMDGPPSTFEVTDIGVHTVNIWMREDGLVVDKIVLTTNPNFTLSGTEPGPPESTRGPRVTAFNPNPTDGATDVPRDTTLSWTPGAFGAKHDVYFGTSFDDVNQATAAVAGPTSVYRGRIDANTYDPGRLTFGQTYYWRIDEVNAPPDNTVQKGNVWSFTAELFAYPVQNIIATASSSDTNKGPQNTVNGSGMDSTGLLHGNIGEGTMWLSSPNDPGPVWIQYEFDKVYKLNEMWIWNSNDSLEQVIGLGIKEAVVEYSTNGTDFTTLGTTYEFAQGTGAAGYAHNTTIDFGGVGAKYVRITAKSNWKGLLPQYGLSEVRFFYIPVNARNPQPASGATDQNLDLSLSWIAGREAGKHNVYFSSDLTAVIDGNAPMTTLTEPQYGPVSLDLGTTYFWRVDEVNDVETPTTWQGDVWNFTTIKSLVVDDFESYNATDNQIWYTWKDGLGYGSPGTPPYYAGNGTGAAVGDENTASFTEETIVHGGKQAMPLSYNNNKPGALNYSETTMTLSSQRDWTARGVKELSLWFRGYPGSVGSFVEGPAGTYTMTAGGADIWGTADQFHFAYKQLSGVGSIAVKVESVQNTNVWAKAGVMIRESLDAGSKFAAVYITPTNADGTPTQGCRFQGRTDTDGSATSDSSVATAEQTAITAPYWVKLERDVAGNFRGYYSSDGVNWQPMVWRPGIMMGSNVYIGLALTSHDPALTCEAKFSNVTTTGTVTGQWQSQDVGIASNSAEPMYVALANSNGTSGVVTYDASAPTQISTWTQWRIDLQQFADQGVNLADVDSLSIGIGDRTNPQPGGSGKMYFDDIELYPEPAVQTPKEVDKIFEAEAADTLGSSWRIYHDTSASGGTYIGSNNGDGSDGNAAPGAEWVASYNFTATAGVYKVLTRVIAPADTDDSFWVRIVGATSQTHEDPSQPGTGWVKFNSIDLGTQWHWDEVHSADHDNAVVNWTLPAGQLTLQIAKREDGAFLDAILITDDLALDETTLP